MMALFLLEAALAVDASDPLASVPDSMGGRDVVVEVGSGLAVNWTRMVLVATSTARAHGAEDVRAVEELARREVQIGMEQGAARVALATGLKLSGVFDDPRLGEALRSRLSRWEVVEAIYGASGQVGLTAELSLQDLFKPWTLHHVRHEPPSEREPRYTGLVVDARGVDVELAWAPRLRAHDGALLYDGTLWEEEAVTEIPVVYIADPSHPSAVRCGAVPMTVRAERAEASDLFLSSQDSVRFRTALLGARILGEGTIVVVVDP